jgi:hypothetical protein
MTRRPTTAIVELLDWHDRLAFCAPCLSDLAAIPEDAVRAALQQLVATGDWRLSARRCGRCNAVGDFLERQARAPQ